MKRGYATGSIYPAVGSWHIDNPFHLQKGNDRWTLIVKDSRFHVILELASFELDNFDDLRDQVFSLLQGCLDALGFHLATPLRISIDSIFIQDLNAIATISNTWHELKDSPEQQRVNAEVLEPFIYVSAAEPLVRLALADLRSALESPEDTVFLAYRAIESVRQWFLKLDEEDSDAARKQSWKTMREALSIDESSLRQVAELAAKRRHGYVSVATLQQRRDSLVLARSIVKSLIAYIAQRRPELAPKRLIKH